MTGLAPRSAKAESHHVTAPTVSAPQASSTHPSDPVQRVRRAEISDQGWDLTAVSAFHPKPPGPERPADGCVAADAAERQARHVGPRLGRLLAEVPLMPGRLTREARGVAERELGVALDAVELDVGTDAQRLTALERALAATRGTKVSFAAGMFRPDTDFGRALIGHELTHVAQQHGNPASTQRFAAALDYERLARTINDAVSGPGTDEEAIFRALRQLDQQLDAVAVLESTYQRLFSQTLNSALRGDLDDEEFDYAQGLLGKAVAATSKQRLDVAPTTAAGWDDQAKRLKAAADYDTFLGFGTDEQAIFAVLSPLANNPDKIAEIKAAYARITGGEPNALAQMLDSELSGSELEYAMRLITVDDPHAGGRAELSSSEVLAVRNELDPTTSVAPPPPPILGPSPPLPPPQRWDGRVGAPGAAANRAALRAALLSDLAAHLARNMPTITPLVAAPKIPVTALEGAANAAVAVTDAEYRSSYAVSAATPGQAAARSGFVFSRLSGNLRAADVPADRVAMGNPINARAVARWMASNDDPPTPPGAIEHMAAHHFDPESPADGQAAWFESDVITPFTAPAATRTKLEQYDQFGFGMQPGPGKIVLPTATVGSSLGVGGAVPNMVDRLALWLTWHLAVHEYLHNLVHPSFDAATTGTVMREGFTEYFTKRVVSKVAPVAHQNPDLITRVEGGIFAPPTTPAMVGPYSTPTSYAANLAHVETVAKVVPGGDNSVRAAYFQGHVEMLGIDPVTGRFAVTPSGVVDPSRVNVPVGITTITDLAARSGVPENEVRSANPGITTPLPPSVRLPGAREHVVAATRVVAGVGPTETDQQIAAQNGVSLVALRRANPGVSWAALTLGQRILIPRRDI